jgi:hypothetical protein
MLRELRQLSRVIHLRAIRWGILALLSLIVTIALHGLPAAAQSRDITQATITEILQGNQVYIQNRLAQVRDLARSGEQVRTRQARVSLRFNTGAIGRLGTNAVLTVGSQCFQLQQGQILVNGAANGCTRSSVAGVRGTIYLLEVDDQQQERFTVLEGQVSLTRRVGANFPPGSRSAASPVLLAAGRRVTISDRGVVGQVQSLTRSEFDQVLGSAVFQDFRDPLPGINALRESYRQLYPGTVFPLDNNRDDQQGWDSTVRLSRLASQGQAAIALQLIIRNKPKTTYANAVYQIYARQGSSWVPVYSNLGARLVSNAPGAITLPPEVIPLSSLRLEQLGLDPRTAILRGVVLLRYDLPTGERDQKLALETMTSDRNL